MEFNPTEPTLYWRAPNMRYEVHIKEHIPSRDLRENYGAMPHRDVALHENDVENPNARPSIRRVSDGELPPVDQFGNRNRKPPAHVLKHVMNAQQFVDSTAHKYGNDMAAMASYGDVAADMKALPGKMAAEAKGKSMFENMMKKAQDEDD